MLGCTHASTKGNAPVQYPDGLDVIASSNHIGIPSSRPSFVLLLSAWQHVDCLTKPLHILLICADGYFAGVLGLLVGSSEDVFSIGKCVLLHLLDSLQG